LKKENTTLFNPSRTWDNCFSH